MTHRVSLAALAALLTSIVALAAAGSAQGQNYGPPGWTSPEPNYYAMPQGTGGLTAAMYPCPRPTPPLTGWTLITYEPFAPQSFLHPHVARYTTCNGCSVTHTSVWVGHHPWFHPSLTNQEPALRTPAHVNCQM